MNNNNDRINDYIYNNFIYDNYLIKILYYKKEIL